MSSNFCDGIANLSYSNGFVTFRMTEFSSQEGITVTLPFCALETISEFFASEIPKIREVHKNWLDFEVARIDDYQAEDVIAINDVGPLIASV